MDNITRQEWRIKTITPLHIGCGQTLLEDFDWVRGDKAVLVLDQERIWHDFLTQNEAADMALLQQPPAKLLRDSEKRPGSPSIKYVLNGLPKGSDQRELLAVIKNVYGQPYLPGSSLKGMLRTVLLWALVHEQSHPLDINRLGNNAKTAAQALEYDFLGKDPNHDVLRVLRVGDSTPLGLETLTLRTVYAFGPANPIPINLEAVKGGVETRCIVSFDNALARDSSLGFFPRAVKMLSDLPALARAWAKTRLDEEKLFAHRKSWTQAEAAIDQLIKLNNRLSGGSFIIQLGWGTGWLGKTIGPALSQGQRELLIDRYRLGRGRRQQGSAFPASRRLTASVDGTQSLPNAPMGWLRIDTAPEEAHLHEAD